MLITGPPDAIVTPGRQYQAAGSDHLVFDRFLRFANREECGHLLREGVFPWPHCGDRRPPIAVDTIPAGTLDRPGSAAIG